MVGTAWGAVPDPENSIIPNVVFVPGGTMEYVVHIESTTGPIDSALVQLIFASGVEPDASSKIICWCSGQSQPLVEATTNASGDASFFIAAGGCVDPDSVSVPPVEVVVNGFSLGFVGCVSPDAVDNDNVYPWNNWVTNGTCAAGTSDAIHHTVPFSLGTFEFCSDIDSSGDIGLADAQLSTAALGLGYSCTQAP